MLLNNSTIVSERQTKLAQCTALLKAGGRKIYVHKIYIQVGFVLHMFGYESLGSLHHITASLTFLSVFPCLSLVLESLPPARYKETISTLLAWLQQCEAKLAIPSTAVTEYPIMEQRLKDIQVHTHTPTHWFADE